MEQELLTLLDMSFPRIFRWPHDNMGDDRRDRMIIGLITTHAISTYHHKRCEFEPRPVLDTTLYDQVC